MLLAHFQLFSSLFALQNSFQLKITVEDIDGSSDRLVEEVIAQVSSLTVDTSLTGTYSGTYGEGSIKLTFSVACGDSYYGSDCATKCVPTDGSDGHYNCNDDGTKSCLSGWSGASTNCLTRKMIIS